MTKDLGEKKEKKSTSFELSELSCCSSIEVLADICSSNSSFHSIKSGLSPLKTIGDHQSQGTGEQFEQKGERKEA